MTYTDDTNKTNRISLACGFLQWDFAPEHLLAFLGAVMSGDMSCLRGHEGDTARRWRRIPIADKIAIFDYLLTHFLSIMDLEVLYRKYPLSFIFYYSPVKSKH